MALNTAYHTFTRDADGALTGDAQSTHPWLTHSNLSGTIKPVVSDGKLVQPASALGYPHASYAQLAVAKSITRMGARWTFSAGSTTDAGGMVLVAWNNDYATTTPTVPDSPFHLNCRQDKAVLGTFLGGTFAIIDEHTYDAPLASDGETVYECEAWIDVLNSRCVMFLPDGTVNVVAHANIGAVLDANVAVWEHFTPAATDAAPQVINIWAD